MKIAQLEALKEVLPSYCCWEQPFLKTVPKDQTYTEEGFWKLTPEQKIRNQQEFNRAENIEAMGLTKDDMYLMLLDPYKYERITELDSVTHKSKFSYRWKYADWDRYFTKGWNILDHVRMHEDIRPYQCEFCERAFTQRCNLKKHRRRHIITDLNDRKKYKCNMCSKGFTERYNLKVRPTPLSNYKWT